MSLHSINKHFFDNDIFVAIKTREHQSIEEQLFERVKSINDVVFKTSGSKVDFVVYANGWFRMTENHFKKDTYIEALSLRQTSDIYPTKNISQDLKDEADYLMSHPQGTANDGASALLAGVQPTGSNASSGVKRPIDLSVDTIYLIPWASKDIDNAVIERSLANLHSIISGSSRVYGGKKVPCKHLFVFLMAEDETLPAKIGERFSIITTDLCSDEERKALAESLLFNKALVDNTLKKVDMGLKDKETPKAREATLKAVKLALLDMKAGLKGDMLLDKVVRATRGMTTKELKITISTLRWIITSQIHPNNTPMSITSAQDIVDFVQKEKISIVNKCSALMFMKSQDSSDVGGLGEIKKFIERKKHCYSPEAGKFGLSRPKGITVAGISGTGKSLIATVLSKELGIPAVRLDVSKLFDKHVGSSESNTGKALEMIKELAPIVVFVDEVEKAFAGIGSSGDSGVGTKVFGSFLTAMQENNDLGIFWVFSANDISGLPTELTRKGRIDEVFGVGFPTRSEVLEVLKIHLRKRKYDPEKLSSNMLNAIVELLTVPNKFVPAEIEHIVEEAMLTSFIDNRSELQLEDFRDAILSTKPISVTSKEKCEEIIRWITTHARPASKEVGVISSNLIPLTDLIVEDEDTDMFPQGAI